MNAAVAMAAAAHVIREAKAEIERNRGRGDLVKVHIKESHCSTKGHTETDLHNANVTLIHAIPLIHSFAPTHTVLTNIPYLFLVSPFDEILDDIISSILQSPSSTSSSTLPLVKTGYRSKVW